MPFKTDLKPIIAAALSRVSLAEVFHQHGIALRKAGEDYVACCPFHSEKTPSCHIYTQQNRYHCFGCAAHGDALTFLMRQDGQSFRESVAVLANMAGVPLPEHFSICDAGKDEWQGSVPGVFGLRKPKDAKMAPVRKFREPTKRWEAPSTDPAAAAQCEAIVRHAAMVYQRGLFSSLAQTYLKERRITAASAERFCLGYADGSSPVCRDMSQRAKAGASRDALVSNYEMAGVIARKGPDKIWADRFRNRLIFPVRDVDGRYCGLGGRYVTPLASGFGKVSDMRPKYINTPETPVYHKSRMLYGLFENQAAIKSARKAILVEGYMDVIGLYQGGIENAVASCGTSLTDAQLTLLLQYTSEIILCFDGDDPGRAAAMKAAEKCPEYLRDDVAIRVLFLPDGKDPHDLMQAPDGVDTFDRLSLNAVPILDVLMRSILDRFPVTDADSADRFMGEFEHYLSQVRGAATREAWKGTAALMVSVYRPVDTLSAAQTVDLAVSANRRRDGPTMSSSASRATSATPRLSDLFVERAIWWLFHLPWEDSIAIWNAVPTSWLAYAQSPALEQLARVLRSLSGGLDGAQTSNVRAILKKVDDQRDFQEAVRWMDIDAKKTEVAAIVQKIIIHATRGRVAFIAGVAERDGLGALTDDEQLLLRSCGRR